MPWEVRVQFHGYRSAHCPLEWKKARPGFQVFTLKNQNRHGRALLEPQNSVEAWESQVKPALAKEGVGRFSPKAGAKAVPKGFILPGCLRGTKLTDWGTPEQQQEAKKTPSLICCGHRFPQKLSTMQRKSWETHFLPEDSEVSLPLTQKWDSNVSGMPVSGERLAEMSPLAWDACPGLSNRPSFSPHRYPTLLENPHE